MSNHKPPTNQLYSPDQLLLDQEATEILDLAKGIMSLWRHQGKGPAYIKLGRCVRYRFGDILEYIENQRIKP